MSGLVTVCASVSIGGGKCDKREDRKEEKRREDKHEEHCEKRKKD